MMSRLHARWWILSIILLASSSMAGAVEFARFDGSSGALDAYTGKGKWVILKIWAHDCGVCNDEAHEYVAFHNKHKDKDAVMLGLSIDGKKNIKKAKKFMRRHKIPYTTLLGEPAAVVNYYQRRTGSAWIGTPTFMIFNPSGNLVAETAGAIPASSIEKFIASSDGSNKAGE